MSAAPQLPPPLLAGRTRPDPDAAELRELGQQLRIDAIRAAAAAGADPPVPAMSAADIMAVLIARHLRFDPEHPDDPARDHLLLSSGPIAALLCAALRAVDAIDDAELLTYGQPGSRLLAERSRSLPLVDMMTGSLGFVLAVATGMALSMRRLEPRTSRIWLICGDDELSASAVWEAIETVGSERLDALTLVVDVSRFGAAPPSRRGWEIPILRRRFEAFDWRVLETDGHDVRAVDNALRTASQTRFRPTAVLARTIRGRGLRPTAGRPGLRGAHVVDATEAIRDLGGPRGLTIPPPKPVGARARDRRSVGRQAVRLPSWPRDSRASVDAAIGEALVSIGIARPDLVVLDGHADGWPHLERFRAVDPRRYFPVPVDDLLLAGATVGFAVRGWLALAGSPSGPLAMAAEAVRIASRSGLPLRLIGSGSGVSGDQAAADIASAQRGLDDLALFRTIDGAAVLQPSDANQAAILLSHLLDWPGVAYLRLTDGEQLVRTPEGAGLEIGGSRQIAASPDDSVLIVASGATVEEAVRATALLAADGIALRIIDAYSVKPLDRDSIAAAAAAVDGRVVVVEDHRPEGGLGEAVAMGLAEHGVRAHLAHLAVRGTGAEPGAGSAAERRSEAGIDDAAIAQAARRLVAGRAT